MNVISQQEPPLGLLWCVILSGRPPQPLCVERRVASPAALAHSYPSTLFEYQYVAELSLGSGEAHHQLAIQQSKQYKQHASYVSRVHAALVGWEGAAVVAPENALLGDTLGAGGRRSVAASSVSGSSLDAGGYSANPCEHFIILPDGGSGWGAKSCINSARYRINQHMCGYTVTNNGRVQTKFTTTDSHVHSEETFAPARISWLRCYPGQQASCNRPCVAFEQSAPTPAFERRRHSLGEQDIEAYISTPLVPACRANKTNTDVHQLESTSMNKTL